MVMLLLGGLVVDASRLLNARGRAVAYAEEAARAGAGAILLDRSELELEPAVVQSRVDDYCSAIEADVTQNLGSQAAGDGVVECRLVPPLRQVSGDDGRELVVVVFVEVTIPASLLGIVGVTELTASGEGRARPYEGVDDQDVDSDPPPVEVGDPADLPGLPPSVDVPVFCEPPSDIAAGAAGAAAAATAAAAAAATAAAAADAAAGAAAADASDTAAAAAAAAAATAAAAAGALADAAAAAAVDAAAAAASEMPADAACEEFRP
jgi:hypothetical protein